MTTFFLAATPSAQAIAWLQQLLRNRIHPDLSLGLGSTSDYWHLSCLGVDSTITLPLLPALYQLGSNPELPCSRIAVADEGFEAIEPDLPAPGLAETPQPLVQVTTDGFHLGYDIPGLTYWMLARCEEVNPPAELLDNHGRFPATSSHAVRHRYLERPIVDEWLGVLRQLVHRLWPQLPLQHHEFRTVVSHDVDVPSTYAFGRKRSLVRSMAARLFKHRDPAGALLVPRIRLATRRQLHFADPFNTFEWLMDQSDAAGIRSAFYFICGRTNPRFDAQYEPEHPAIRSLMRRIHERGHVIGLHPSYNTCQSPEAIVAEAVRLQRITAEEGIEQSQWGGRMHYLRWQWPITAYGWEQAGFQYDSTLGYADRPGFRCGTCHEYQMFAPIAQSPLNLRQRPLIMMECSVLDELYLGLRHEPPTALSLIHELKQRCQSVNGQFTMLWHNNHLSSEEDRELYQRVVME